ncbi:MAG: hypothetical protein ABI333_11695 [bacterium]
MSWFELALPGLLAFVVSALATPVVRGLARRFGAVARPRADRWHAEPTALMGGIAIFLGFAVAFLTLWPFPDRRLPVLALCGAGMFGLGLLDDLVSLRPAAKLAGQIAVAATFTFAGVLPIYTFVPVIDIAITILWLVGITNALNLLDNLDGQAAGVTVIAAGFLAYFFLAAGQPLEAGVALAVVGAALGFLLFNWNPASIFMGDSGSLLLGFLLAGVTLFNQSHRTRNLLATLAVPLLVLIVPILDTALVTLARKAHGRAVSQGGTDHISHRLVALGLTERMTVLVVYGVAIASGLMAIFVRQLPTALAIAAVPVFLGLLWFGLMIVGRVRVYRGDAAGRLPQTATPEGGAGASATGAADAADAAGDAADADAPGEMAPRSVLAIMNMANRHQILLVLFDLLAVIFCYYLAFMLRFGSDTAPFLNAFLASLPVVIAVQIGLFWLTGLYRTVWRFFGLTDVARLGISVLVGVAGSVAAATFLFRFTLLSRAVFAVDAVLLFLVLAFGRFVGRASWLVSQQQDRRANLRTLIYGAGAAGSAAVRELRESVRWPLRPIGFLDDNPELHGRIVQGGRVFGGLDRLEEVSRERRAEALLVTIQHLEDERWQELRDRCRKAGLKLRHLQLAIVEVALEEPEPPADKAESETTAESEQALASETSVESEQAVGSEGPVEPEDPGAGR